MRADSSYLDLALGSTETALVRHDCSHLRVDRPSADWSNSPTEQDLRFAVGLIDSTYETIRALQHRVDALEAEKCKSPPADMDWGHLNTKWHDLVSDLKLQIRDLQDDLLIANRKNAIAEMRKRNAEEYVSSTERLSLNLFVRLIEALGDGQLASESKLNVGRIGSC